MLSGHLQEELNRNQLLSMRLQEAEKKLAMQDKTTKRERAELEDRCKKKEKRISLMEENLRELDFEMRTKQKRLEKLNLYSQRIEKNLPPNMNVSDLLPSQEDKYTMTSQYLLESQLELAPIEEQRFALPPTRSQAQSSNSTNYTRASFQTGQDAYPPTQASDTSMYTRKHNYDISSALYPTMTHSETGNCSDSDMMPTLHTSSDLTSFTTQAPSIDAKSSPHTSDLISPPMPHTFPDPPLSTIKEISASTNKSPLKAQNPRALHQTNTPVNVQLNPLQHSLPDSQKPRDNQIDSTKKEMLLQRLKQIDSSSTNQSLPTDSLASSKNQSLPTDSLASSKNQSLPIDSLAPNKNQSLPTDSLASSKNQSLPIDSLASSKNQQLQPENLEMQTNYLRQDETSGSDTPVSHQFDSTGSKGRKKKTFALDDLFSSSSAQSSDTKLLQGSNMDPGLFSAPRQDSPLFSQDKQNGLAPQEQRQARREEGLALQQNLSSKANHLLGEDTHDIGRKPSVVENMYHGKPAYSTEDDFYGSKLRKTSPEKTSHAFNLETDSEKSQAAQHGRRAREINSPTNSGKNYFWENSVAPNPHKPSAPVVDDVDDDLEVIQL